MEITINNEYQKKRNNEFRLALIEIAEKIKKKFGEGNYTFGIEMGNYTSGEYGSYCITFHKDNKYCCNVIWDWIFGNCKVIVLD